MRSMMLGLMTVGLAIAASASADELAKRTTSEVLQHHITAFRNGDIAELMKDYSDKSVVVTPAGLTAPGPLPGVYLGTDAIRKLFEMFAQPENAARNRAIKTKPVTVSADVVAQFWTMSSGTPQEASGTDTFVIREGRIVFQDIRPLPAGTKPAVTAGQAH
jgi:ketosteroid isomerase-like protein